MSLEVKQSAEDKGQGFWEWAVWLEGSPAELDEVETVEYFLHPTFSNPHVVTGDRSSGFKLSRSGWGGFPLLLKIHRRDGSVEVLEHSLRLGEESEDSRGEHHRPSVFLTHNLVDGDWARILQEALEEEDIEVATSEDFGLKGNWQAALSSALERADSAVVVLSTRPNAWVTQEAAAAKARGIPVTSIVVGPELRMLPSSLVGSERIDAKGADEVRGAGRELARRLKACA